MSGVSIVAGVRYHDSRDRAQPRQPPQKLSYVKAITIEGTLGLNGAGFYPE
jgi:hypothetical protein